MDITWYGHSCFRLLERGQKTLITDPYAPQIGLPELKLKAEIVTISHDVPGHNAVDSIKGVEHVVTRPGEYEMGGVFITGIALHHIDETQGVVRPNIAYRIQYDNNLTVLHLGDLAQLPDQSTAEKLGEIHILLIPVGGGNGMKPALAAEVIAMIEPSYVIPMHYALPGLALELEPLDKFLKAMGISHVQEAEMLRVSASDLPEQPQVVALVPQVKLQEAGR